MAMDGYFEQTGYATESCICVARQTERHDESIQPVSGGHCNGNSAWNLHTHSRHYSSD